MQLTFTNQDQRDIQSNIEQKVVQQIQKQILKLLIESQNPERVVQATNKITQLRRNQSYRLGLLILMLGYDQNVHKMINPMQYLAQLKVITSEHQLTQIQQNFLMSNSYYLFIRFAKKNQHKMLRKIIENLTLLANGDWLDLQIFTQKFIEARQDDQNLTYFISALIGIPQAYKYSMIINPSHKQKLNQFEILVPALLGCYQKTSIPLRIHYIVKFLKKFIYACSAEIIMDYNKSITFFVDIGIKLWTKQTILIASDNQASDYNQYGLYLSKARKWFSKLLKFCFMRQQQYSRKQTQKQHQFAEWQTQKMVLFLNLVVDSLHDYQIYKPATQTELCQSVINTNLFEFLSLYFAQFRPVFMFKDIQKFLYVTIPKHLFSLKKVIDYKGQFIKFYQPSSIKNVQRRYKAAALKFWLALNELDHNQAEKKIQKYFNLNMNVAKNKNRLIQNKLQSKILNMKFIFQKLSQCQTFFSPFQKRSQLRDQNIWDFQKDQSWIIVAFDLLKANYDNILNNPNYESIKSTVPILISTYILPRILSNNTLIQIHAISLLVTYKQFFKELAVSQKILNQLQSIIQLEQLIQCKQVLLKSLPQLYRNLKINKLIQKNIDLIVTYYILALQKQEDYNIVKCFVFMIRYFGIHLKDKQRYFTILIERLIQSCRQQSHQEPTLYTQCLEPLMNFSLRMSLLRQKMFYVFKYAMYYIENLKLDQLLQDQLLRIISIYLDKEQKVNNLVQYMFVMLCLALSNFNKEVRHRIQRFKQGPHFVKKAKNLMQCQQEAAPTVLWILQKLSLKNQMYLVSQKYAGQPLIYLYINVLQAYTQNLKKSKIQREMEYLQAVGTIVKGFIAIIEERGSSLQDQLIVQMWTIAISTIFETNKKQIFQCLNSKKKDEKQNKQKQMNDNTNKEQYQVRKNIQFLYCNLRDLIVQFISCAIYFCTQSTCICLQETNSVTQQYVIMAQAAADKSQNHNLFRKKVIFGLAYLIQNKKLQQQCQRNIIAILLQYYIYCKDYQKSYQQNYLKQMNKRFKQTNFGGLQLSQDYYDWESDQGQQLEQSIDQLQFYTQDDHQNIRIFTEEAWDDVFEYEAIQIVLEIIDDVYPNLNKYKDLLKQLKNCHAQMARTVYS